MQLMNINLIIRKSCFAGNTLDSIVLEQIFKDFVNFYIFWLVFHAKRALRVLSNFVIPNTF